MLLGLAVLALVSWVFGIMMAVAQDLPELENREQYRNAENSVVYDRNGGQARDADRATSSRILIESSRDLAQHEAGGRRDRGRALLRAPRRRLHRHRRARVFQDVLARSAVQGGSTITQQFVKNALAAQDSRTVFQKLRESALAYQLEREWSKDKILTQYLNSIYFGEGAYGIESAAKTFFGYNHPGCGGEGDRCASAAASPTRPRCSPG